MDRIPTVERAYQMARSGQFANTSEIALRLKLDGYSDGRAQLGGRSIRNQLLTLCRAARLP